MPSFSSPPDYISRLCLVAAVFVFGYLMVHCIIPPNPNSQKSWKNDRISLIASGTVVALVYPWFIALYTWHAALIYTLPHPPEFICPNVERINDKLFTWNAITISSLLVTIVIGAPLRLGAYTGLGRNFTYALAAPDKLVTDGIYSYIQHPSYTGLVIVVGSALTMFARWDGAVACWIPAIIYDSLPGNGPVAICLALIGMAGTVWSRVQDEEAMLKQVFGASWETWHRKTARFIPGLL